MSKEAEFFIYLIERYADSKNKLASEILRLWDSLDITDLIFNLYGMYHIERLENAFDDIDQLIEEHKAEWA